MARRITETQLFERSNYRVTSEKRVCYRATILLSGLFWRANSWARMPCLAPAVIYTTKIQAGTCGKHQCCRGWSKSTANAQDASTTTTSNVHLIAPSQYGNSAMPLSHGGPQNALRMTSGSSYFTQAKASLRRRSSKYCVTPISH